MNVIKSTTFQFSVVVLVIGLLMVITGQVQGESWLNTALATIGIYAAKEGVKYGSSAYQNKGTGAG